MPNQSLRHPFPEPPPWNAPDPVPVMRREMKLLLIELNVLRVEENSCARAETGGAEKQNASTR
jgi:hypothetical protein